MTVEFINTQQQLIKFCADIANTSWMTVDTEFLREKTYHAQLCLIQIATDDHIACIDPLTIENLCPLLDLIYNPNITNVFHAARQDLELFYLLKGELPPVIFDTQLAATVLGYGDQIGYGNLVKQCLNVELDKAHSRTDWSKRPLDSAQIEYAADDVRYLRDLYKQLLNELEHKQRLSWLEEDFDQLTNPSTYQIDPQHVWKKIKGAGRLKGNQLAVIQKLADWREQRAIESNRPRRWILKDEVLVDLARLSPSTKEKLRVIRGLEEGTINLHGETLIAIINQAKKMDKNDWPTIKKSQPLTNQQDAVIDVLMGLVRKYCDDQSIAPAAVATRKELERIVLGEDNIALLQGWRNEIVGRHLSDFLNGQLSITSNSNQLSTQEQG
jgi:ribonuclease D